MPMRMDQVWLLLCLVLVSCGQGTPSVEVLIERAHLQERQGRLAEAVETYNQILQIDPNRASVYYDRGVAYDALQNYEASFQDYSKTIELDRGFYRAYNNRAVLQSRRGEFAAAVADCNETLLLNPEDALAYRNRGFARLNLEKFNEALEDFNESIRIDGRTAMSYVLRGQAYQAIDRHDRAVEDFEQAIRLDSQLPDGFYFRAISRAKRGEFDAAQKDLDLALQIDREIVVSQELRALLTDRPAKVASSQSLPDLVASPEPSMAELAEAMNFTRNLLKEQGFTVDEVSSPETRILNLTNREGKSALAYVVVSHREVSDDISIPANVVNELRMKNVPVHLIVIRNLKTGSDPSKLEFICRDEVWLSDPSRLEPANFRYRIPETPPSDSEK